MDNICAKCRHDQPGYSSVVGTHDHLCERHWHCKPGSEALDYEPRTAVWLGGEYDGYADGYPVYETWVCSACGGEVASEGNPPDYKFCPYCGLPIMEFAGIIDDEQEE